ncbi:MAG: hypothetical protein ACRCX8_18520 [Sarcina sp.]
MIKLSNCKELNWYDHYDILDSIDNIKYDRAVKYLRILNKAAVKIEGNKCLGDFIVIHSSTKEVNSFQVSYFNNNNGNIIAIGDTHINRSSKSDLLKFKEIILKHFKNIIK